MSLPTEAGLYFHLSVDPTDTAPSKREAHICKVYETGFFWHPVHCLPQEARGSFIRIPEELHEAAWAEAKEVFVAEKAKWILSFRSGWDRKRYMEEVVEEFRGLVQARVEELSPDWIGGRK